MKSIKIGAMFSLMLLLFGGCLKLDLPESSIAGIAFGVEGQIDGVNTYIGLDSFDYEFLTGKSSALDLDVFEGRFNSFDNSKWKMNFYIRNSQQGAIFDSAFWKSASSLEFMDNASSLAVPQIPVQYNLISELSSISSANTTIQPGNIQLDGHQNTVNLVLGTEYTFCTEYTDQQSSGKFCCIMLSDVNQTILSVNFGMSILNQQTLQLTASSMGPASVTGEYKWSTGETGNTITVNSPGIYAVTFTDQEGRAVYHEKKIGLAGDGSSLFIPNVNPEFIKGPVYNGANPEVLSTIDIHLIDSEGIVYTVSNLTQPGTSNFEITESRLIGHGPFGNKGVMAMKVKFNCKVESLFAGSKDLKNFEGWIGVGIE